VSWRPIIIIGSLLAFIFGDIFFLGAVDMPLLPNEICGRQHFAKVFPMIGFISNIGIALANTLVGYVYDLTGSNSLAFIIGIIFQIFD